MLSFDFDFRARRPNGEPGRAVEQIWYARGTVPYRSELVAPTGSTVILFILGDPIRQTPTSGRSVTSAEGLVIGPHTAPVENAPLGETFAVGIVTTSVGCEAVSGVRPSALRGRVERLDRMGNRIPDLRARLAELGSAAPERFLDEVDRHLEASVALDIPGLDRVERAVALLESEPRRPIAEVAGLLGVTHAHLDREFGRIVGLAPRSLARLLLLRRVLEQLDPTRDVSWADLAFENGWSDQAHFSRDFKRHTGVTPRRYLEIQRSIGSSGDGDGAGFSPDLTNLR